MQGWGISAIGREVEAEEAGRAADTRILCFAQQHIVADLAATCSKHRRNHAVAGGAGFEFDSH